MPSGQRPAPHACLLSGPADPAVCTRAPFYPAYPDREREYMRRDGTSKRVGDVNALAAGISVTESYMAVRGGWDGGASIPPEERAFRFTNRDRDPRTCRVARPMPEPVVRKPDAMLVAQRRRTREMLISYAVMADSLECMEMEKANDEERERLRATSWIAFDERNQPAGIRQLARTLSEDDDDPSVNQFVGANLRPMREAYWHPNMDRDLLGWGSRRCLTESDHSGEEDQPAASADANPYGSSDPSPRRSPFRFNVPEAVAGQGNDEVLDFTSPPRSSRRDGQVDVKVSPFSSPPHLQSPIPNTALLAGGAGSRHDLVRLLRHSPAAGRVGPGLERFVHRLGRVQAGAAVVAGHSLALPPPASALLL